MNLGRHLALFARHRGPVHLNLSTAFSNVFPRLWLVISFISSQCTVLCCLLQVRSSLIGPLDTHLGCWVRREWRDLISVSPDRLTHQTQQMLTGSIHRSATVARLIRVCADSIHGHRDWAARPLDLIDAIEYSAVSG
jgi:hypothetical protein